MRQIEERH